MFVSSLVLGLVILPFVSAVLYDVTVGANGTLLYEPQTLVRNSPRRLSFFFSLEFC